MKDQDKTKQQLIAELESLRRKVSALGQSRTGLNGTEKSSVEFEQEMRSLYKYLPVSYQSLDENGFFLEVNDAWLTILGYSREEVVGKWFGAFLTPASQEIFKINFPKFKADGEVHGAESEMLAKNCSPITVLFDGQIERDERGRVKRTHCFFRDISALKQSQEALKESERRYKAVVDNIEVGISVLNSNMEIVEVNKALRNLFPHGTCGQICYEHYHNPPRSDICPYCPCVLTFQDGEVHEVVAEVRVSRGDRYFHFVSSPIKDSDGRVQYVIALSQDITEQRNLQRQLLQSQKMEALGILSGGIAHDFNNILTVVLGFSELLLSGADEHDTAREDLNRIHEAAQKGAELVQRILAFSRKTEINLHPLDLNYEIVQVKRLLARTIPKMIQIELDLSNDLAAVNADPGQIEQVLMNLAVNARDAMPDGGKLTIETKNVVLDEAFRQMDVGFAPGNYVLLSVSDTGHGMNQEILDHIFEPFYTTKDAGRGTGLGLSMVYGIVKQHGGYVTCCSEPGQGATFKIYLPQIAASEEISGRLGQEALSADGSETILLVDDEEFIRDLGKRVLEQSGYTVLTAPDGKEALDVYGKERKRISLVILDLIMPGMGGNQCLRELLKIDSRARVLLASGGASDGETKETNERGARGFVGKPYNTELMLQTIRQVLDSD